MTKLNTKLKEIVADCVFTGYDNANELIDKTVTAIKSAFREVVPESTGDKDTISGWFDGWDSCRNQILKELK